MPQVGATVRRQGFRDQMQLQEYLQVSLDPVVRVVPAFQGVYVFSRRAVRAVNQSGAGKELSTREHQY